MSIAKVDSHLYNGWKYGHIHTFCGHTLTNIPMWISVDSNISMRLYEYRVREKYFYQRLLILKSIYCFYHTDFYKLLATEIFLHQYGY